MEIKNPIVIHMAFKLEQLEEAPLRAAYMVVEQLYSLQNAKNNSPGSTISDMIKTGVQL